MDITTQLEFLLEQANWQATEESRRLGNASLPVLQKYATHENYQIRQIALACAAPLAAALTASMLAMALIDSNINVRVTAANALAEKAYPPELIAGAVLEQMMSSPDEIVQEKLALAAGYLPGENTLDVLRKLSPGTTQLATNARLALVKLGDPESRTQLLNQLTSPIAKERYEVIESLQYVNDRTLVPVIKKFLRDSDQALMIGTKRNPRYRRVCDQAVDTIIFLLKLTVNFPHDPERIYRAEEIQQVEASMG